MSNTIHPPEGPCYTDLRGGTALVTGGGSGIGRGISLRLAVEGMQVFLVGRTEETLQATAEDIREAGGSATPMVADLATAEGIACVTEAMASQMSALDLLVHNAAWVRGRPLWVTSADDWRQMFATNTDSAYYLTRAAMDIMVPRGRGCLIFISTIGAQRPHQGMAAYDASKGALEVFTRSMALELAPSGIRVNGIAPGPISRDAHDKEIPAGRLRMPMAPMGRRGTPAEVAAAVAFLASAQASYITGQILAVDGGVVTQLSPPGIFV